MRRGQDDHVDVVIVEDDGRDVARHGAQPLGDGTTDAHDAPGAPVAGRRRGRRAVAVLLVLAAVVVVVGNVVGLVRERREVAALADLPGVLRPLTQAPSLLWSVPDAWPVLLTDDVVVLSERDGLVAVAPSDGRTLWRLAPQERSVDSCTGIGPGSRGAWLPGGRSGASLMLCHGSDWGRVGDAVRASQVTSFRVVAVADGATVGELELAGSIVHQAVVGEDPLHVLLDGDGHAEVVRWDGGTGQVLWRFRTPGPVGPAGDSTMPHVGTSDDVISLQGSEGRWEISTADGTPLAEHVGAGGPTTVVFAQPLAGGDVLRSAWDGASGTSDLVAADGTVRFSREGMLLAPPASDTRSGLLVVVEFAEGVSAVHVATGEERWRTTVQGYPVAQVGDAVVMRDAEAVTVLDLADGAQRWTAGAAEGDWFAATDGRSVVVTRSVDDTDLLVGLDLRTGEERWRLALDRDVHETAVVAGTVLTVSSAGVRAYGAQG